MKFTAALLLIAATAVSASKVITSSSKAGSSLLRSARKLNEEGGEDDYSYLGNYALTMVSCAAGETVINAEDGGYEYGAVTFRLCPTTNGCSDESVYGCTEGYGDYVVSLATFVAAYFEDQKDNMNWDDKMQVDEYAECKEYEVDNDGGNDNGYQYWLGPSCTADGTDIMLAMFSDETCLTPSTTEFETISNGWSLPYGTGGLVSNTCQSCIAYNDNNEAELKELCSSLKMSALSQCETKMEYYSYYGKNEQGCSYIETLLPVASKNGSGGKAFGWVVFVCVVVGFAGYVVWWRKKKSTSGIDTSM